MKDVLYLRLFIVRLAKTRKNRFKMADLWYDDPKEVQRPYDGPYDCNKSKIQKVKPNKKKKDDNLLAPAGQNNSGRLKTLQIN